jgi:hypothetical protein
MHKFIFYIQKTTYKLLPWIFKKFEVDLLLFIISMNLCVFMKSNSKSDLYVHVIRFIKIKKYIFRLLQSILSHI